MKGGALYKFNVGPGGHDQMGSGPVLCGGPARQSSKRCNQLASATNPDNNAGPITQQLNPVCVVPVRVCETTS